MMRKRSEWVHSYGLGFRGGRVLRNRVRNKVLPFPSLELGPLEFAWWPR